MFCGFPNVLCVLWYCSVGLVVLLCVFCGLQNTVIWHARYLKHLISIKYDVSKCSVCSVVIFCGLQNAVLWHARYLKHLISVKYTVSKCSVGFQMLCVFRRFGGIVLCVLSVTKHRSMACQIPKTSYLNQILRFQMFCGFSKCSVCSVVMFCGLQNAVLWHARYLKHLISVKYTVSKCSVGFPNVLCVLW